MLRSVPWYLAAVALLVAGVASVVAGSVVVGVFLVLLSASPLAIGAGVQYAARLRPAASPEGAGEPR